MTMQDSSSSSTASAAEKEADLLYEKREKIYPRAVHGVFARLRSSAATAMLGLYFVQPWIDLNGQQIVLFDLPARKFHIYGLTFWPQDFLFLAFILILLAFMLFFFTALAGRLWCGYACPQTVWTEVYLWVERKLEGTPNQQRKLDKSPLTVKKAMLKSSKHFIWLLIAFITAFTFVAYFSPAKELTRDLLVFSLNGWEFFWILFFTVATYVNAGWMREQVCKYMCPYARFQSAMFDDETLIISYDEKRGEPRGSRRSDVHVDYSKQELGDCINCTMCVQVCPTGIDIRDGLQYECIGCSACIDVCDSVMEKMSYPKGLIRYTTQNAMEGKKSRIIRPRIVIYFCILSLLSVLFLFSMLTRSEIDLNIIRDRNQLYRETQGFIENIYRLKLINMDDKAHEFVVTADGIENLVLMKDKEVIIVGPGSMAELPVRLRARESNLDGQRTAVYFTLTAKDAEDMSIRQEAAFLGPLP